MIKVRRAKAEFIRRGLLQIWPEPSDLATKERGALV